MADDFDPYYTWLGIPPEEQPADHYRLLGVRRFESNADVITNAMDQRMHYLRSLQVGKRSALSQKILNEVSSAGVVLLDPKRRAEYDQQLKAKEAKETKAASASGVAAAAAPGAAGGKVVRPLPVAASLPKAAPLPLQATGSPPATAQAGPSVVVNSSPSGRAEKPTATASLFKSPVVLGGASFAAVAMIGLVALIVVQSMQEPKPDLPDNKHNVTVTDKGSGKVKPKGNGADKGNNKTPTVDPMTPVTAAAPAWTTDADSQRLFVLELDKRASMEIEQTAGWVSLEQDCTIEGWFKPRPDAAQTMSLFGTRSGGSSGTPTQGWELMARRGVENGKLADQLVLEAWKSGGQLVHIRAPWPRPTDWHHLALVCAAGKEWLLYVDGKEAFRYPAESGLTSSGANLRLGDDANRRGSGLDGHVCGLRISDTVRYQKPFAPPAPLLMVHDQPTAASLHFTMAVPGAAAGTIRRSAPEWRYGYGRYDEGTKKVESFTAMLEWDGLAWKPGPSLPRNVAEWMSLDPLGGHAGNGPQHAVIRRWTAPADGNLAIAGQLTHAHETQFGDGVRGRIVSSSAGAVGQWEARFSAIATPVAKLPVKKGETVDFLVECKNDNHCDKFAWQLQLALTDEAGKSLGAWDTEKNFHGPNLAGAVYQLARLNGARWQRLDPSAAVGLTQLAPIPSVAPQQPASGRLDLIQSAFDERKPPMRGQVTREGTSLRTKENDPTAFTLPVAFPEEYVLEAEIVRESGEDSICFGFPVPGGRRMTAIVDGQKGTRSGLTAVNDQQIFTNGNPLVRPGRLLATGTPAVVRINVSKAAVELNVNGSSIATWKVNPNDKVLLAKGMGYANPKAMAIFTWNSPFRINRLEMIPQPSGAAPGPLASQAGRIDLVARYAGKIELVRGQVTYSTAGGWRAEGQGAAFMLPESMPDEYALEAEITREEGTGSISFHLPVRGRPLSAIIDIYDSRLTGLSDINDWNIQSADNPTVHRAPVLTNGQPAQVRVVVSQQEISLSVDGKKLSSWAYDPGAKLNAFQGLRLPDPKKLGVTTGNSTFRIKRLDLIAGGAPDSRPALAAGSPIDLIDASRRTVRPLGGTFQVSGNSLTTGSNRTRVAVDAVELPDEYVLEGEVTRLSGSEALGFGLTVQGRPLSVLLDGWNSTRSGICLVPGQDAKQPGGATIRQGPLLTKDKTAKLKIAVSRREVALEIDGQPTASWQNDPQAALRPFGDYEPDGNKLTITSWFGTSFKVANLKLIPGGSSPSSPATAAAPSLAGAKKQPVPDDAAKAKANTQIAAVFAGELKAAKTPPAKAAVAKKIKDLAGETKDLATKYVMLEEARRLFVEVKDVGSAMQIVETVSQEFDVAPLPAKVKLLETIGEGNLSAAQRADIVAEACTLGFEAIDSDQFDVAQAMAAVVRAVAARATAADVKAEAKEFIDEFVQRQKRWEAVRRAEQTLTTAPDDPAANLALGLYHLFDRGDQAKGLAMLVKGSDAKLAAAAKARQANASQGLAGSLAEADAWFDCLAAIPAEYKAAVQKRAMQAYDLASASAEGLDKAKAEKRRDQLKAELAAAPASTAASASKRGPRIRKSDLPESSSGLVGRVYLGGKDAGILVTFDPQRTMDTTKLRGILAQARLPGGRIVLEGTLTCPTPMSMYVSHRGASTAATQQVLVNGKVLSTVGGGRREYDSERLQLVAGNHLVQWIIEFDGSTAPYLHIYEDGNSRRVPLNFSREQNYGARKLTTNQELDLSE